MEKFVDKVREYQEQQLVCIGHVDVSVPRASVTVSSFSDLPLNLKLLVRLAHECSLDWHVKLSSTPGDSIFVARPMPEDEEDRSEAIPAKDSQYSRAVISVLRVLRAPRDAPRGFEVDVRESENGAWVGISNKAETQLVLTREMLNPAVSHTATLQAQLKRSTVQLEISVESSRKRLRNEDDQMASPRAKRRALMV